MRRYFFKRLFRFRGERPRGRSKVTRPVGGEQETDGCVSADTMKSSPPLLLLLLLLQVTLGSVWSRCEEPRRASSDERLNPLQRLILKRYSDLDYDSFVGLMGRRSSDAEDVETPEKREMHDIFVGLMGRRSSDAGDPRVMVRPSPDQASWRSQAAQRPSVYLNRFLQGL
ncbi:tachykinin-3a isoform X2 [Synchiropus splendidus]|uniref:tachykinin-3a isoform X2 n=1 Tax=Synchiropus splendidus TaxID=270530 RepID=UPI00237E6A7D|nr:tachykinin-3a isoform X2 [Synchiropus splendidus]